MTIEPELLKEAEGNLLKISNMLGSIDLERRFGPTGNTAAAIIYHTAESTKFWLNTIAPSIGYKRYRDAEFNDFRSKEEILQAFSEAFEKLNEVSNSGVDLRQIVDLGDMKASPDIHDWNVAKVLIHISTHVAYHYAQLKAIQLYK